MARIRTIKPEFFKHEILSELEQEEPTLKIMLTFAGLWTISDNQGVFEWRPMRIKNEILPFIEFDINKSLEILTDYGFIKKYNHLGKDYGFVISFRLHQRFSGKEFKEGSRYFLPDSVKNCEVIVKHKGSNGEVIEKQYGNIKEALVNSQGSIVEELEKQSRTQEKEKEKEKERKMQEGNASEWIYQKKLSNEIFKNENLANEDKLDQLEKLIEGIENTETYNDLIEKINFIKSELQEKEKTSEQKENETVMYKSQVLCKNTFLEFYIGRKKTAYFWNGKDAGALKLLIGKFIFTIKSTDRQVSANLVNDSFSMMLDKISSFRDTWVYDNLSIPIICSKYNEILNKIINGNSISEAGKGVSEAYFTDIITRISGAGKTENHG